MSDAEPLRRSMELDASAYRAALADLIALHEDLGGAAETGATQADRGAQRTGQAAQRAAGDVKAAGASMGSSYDAAARKGEQSAERRRSAEEQAAQKAGQSWREFVGQRLGDYQRMEGGHGAAMRRIASEWSTYKAAGLAATNATERGLRAVGEEADRTRRKLDGAAGEFDRFGRAAGRGAKFGGVAQDAAQVGQALRSGDLPGAAVGLGQLQGSAAAAGLTTGRALALGAGAAGIAAVGAAAVKATANAAAFEEQLVAVKRTAGLSDAEIEKLRTGLIGLSSRLGVTTGDLAAIAESAGSLGIQGAEKITAFTEVVAKFSSATGMSAAASADGLGRVSVAFREPIENAERLGSVLDKLADDTGATTEQILFSLQRVGAGGAAVGLTSGQVAAFVAVMNEAGVDASDAGTTMRNALTIVQTEAGKVSRVMGTTKEAWLSAFGADPQKALTDLLGKLKELEPTARAIALDDIFGRENMTGVSTLVSNLDRVTVALDAQSQAYADGTRLQESFEQSTGTLAAQWRILSATMTGWLTDAGAPVAESLADLLRLVNNVTGATTNAEEAHRDYTSALADQQALGRLIERHEELTKKTTLTATEQSELKAIIKAIGEQVPSAITKWDDLGAALDVHMGKVRETASDYRDLARAMQMKAETEAFGDASGAIKQRERARRLLDGTGTLGDVIMQPGRNPMRDPIGFFGDAVSGLSGAEIENRDRRESLAESTAALATALRTLAQMPRLLTANEFTRRLPGSSLNDYGQYLQMRTAGTAGAAAPTPEPEGDGTYTPESRRKRGPSAETLASRARREAERAGDADFEAQQYARLRGAGTQYAATQAAVAAALEKATAAQAAYAAALDAPPDVLNVGEDGVAVDGAGTDALRQRARMVAEAYEARVRAASTYEQALRRVETAETAVHEASQARDRAAQGSEERADLDAIVRARSAAVEQARRELTLAEGIERAQRHTAAALDRMSDSGPLAKLVEAYGGMEALERDGLDLDAAGRGQAIFTRAEAVRKTVGGARAQWERAQASGDAEYEEQALDGYRAASADANRQVMEMIETFRTLDVPPKLAEWLSELLTALAADVPEGLADVRSIREQVGESNRAGAAEADIARQEQAVRLLERGAASLDETAQLADAWGAVGTALGVLPQRAAAAASAFAGVFRALSGVRQMQADIARIELQRKTLGEASRAAQAAGDGARAGELAAQAGSLAAPSGIAAMMPYVGVAMAGISVVSSLVAWGKQSSEEYKQLRRSLADAATSISRAVSDARRVARLGSDVSQKDADAVSQAVAALRAGGMTQQQRESAYRTIYNSSVPGADALKGQYDAAFGVLQKGGGLSTSEIRKILDDVLFGDGVDAKGFDWRAHLERMMGGPMEAFGSWFDEWASGLGQYTDSVAAALARMDFVTRYLGGSATDALAAFVGALESTGGLPEELRSLLAKAKTLDVTTEAGRKELLALLAPLLQSFYAGTLRLPEGSDLTSDDLLAILDALTGIGNGEGGAGEGGYSRQAQIAGTITEVQTNELLFWQAEQTRVLRAIEALLRGALGAGPVATAQVIGLPPLTPIVPLPLGGASLASAMGGSLSPGGSLVVNVRAEHRIDDIMEQIAGELRRSALFDVR